MLKFSSEVENFSAIAEFKQEILSKRDIGEVIFDIKKIVDNNINDNSENQIAILDLFVTELGYSSLGSHWKQIDREAAQKVLILLMTKDLAYSGQIMSLEEAEQIVVKLFSFFSERCSFFTNALFTDNCSRISEWNSITEATFDTGIVGICDSKISILWVKDED